ncbi:di-trans,poly-cis-decaprenylcistransferase [Candidatus Epulonipiscium fishelsonii]|uniref:Di-trans,poly-cis-decaprenylcistransferase n=1 Tax=Candidatus Epulonipiscium fishelsonii TaxID=77094 RepID=A0ACC8XE04_9FIRM|nr:di-trans,poly-cis-decaprenylcistransferase [Epulopiscium sp. SCG-B05WGA-EpuloA1]ONI41014.1 di-trans,poly-cis-decaprenylcistransferase [Epulopiscium sp. SCG-B11WGA-EpuloA1]ONI47410.1 di-trans,poly-cis-decaprenylcistransferase [Epulopiscium sp. SCG-C06WGA-EpuloA1]
MHVAIIMDGNGRWAKQKGISRNEGHKIGSETLKKIVRYADTVGIEYITVYAFSTENWNRPKEEVEGLMNLLTQYLIGNIKNAKKENLRFRLIGRRDNLPPKMCRQIDKLEQITKNKTGLCLSIALNYGGRDEIVRACKALAEDVKKEKCSIDEINEKLFESYLDTHKLPDPDLVIRTSGELRLSNFLIWQLAYSEFYFTDCLWPDFTVDEFKKAINAFSLRKRRFGKSE